MDTDVNSVPDLVAWIDAMLDKLKSDDAELMARDYWPQVWEDARGYANALGVSDAAESAGGPIPHVSYVCEKDGVYDYATPERAVRDQLKKRLVRFRDSVLKGKPRWDEATEARNKFVYEQCRELTLYKTIISQVCKRPEWEPLNRIPSVSRAAKAYAKRHALPPPPARKSGRPSKRHQKSQM